MEAFRSSDRSPWVSSLVAEKGPSYGTESAHPSESSVLSAPDDLPRRIETSNEGDGKPQTFFVLGEEELHDVLAVVRQCKAQAKLVADSLLQQGPDSITESNAAYGLERQMAALQKEIQHLMR